MREALVPCLHELLTLVTVGYNSADVIADHFKSLVESARHPLPRWIFVDNASTDDTTQILADFEGVVECINNTGNLGYGAACNIGIGAARTRYVLVLNPDTLLSEGAIEALLVEMIRHRAAIVGPALRAVSDADVQPVDWLVGAAMLFDRQIMDTVGYFDERFFLFREDADICKRANDAGQKVLQCRNVSIPHIGAGSTSRTDDLVKLVNYHKGRSYVLFVRKHGLGDALIDAYIRKNKRRMRIAWFTFGFSRYRRAKAKLEGVRSVE